MIRVQGLTKVFDQTPAVAGIDLDIPAGGAFTLLGPLGCGNSSVIKMLATIIRPTHGTAQVGDFDLIQQPESVRQITGYMPDVLGAYNDMKVDECLRVFALGHLLDGDLLEQRLRDVLAWCEIESLADIYIASLDAEQRKRLALARVLLHDPAVLLLDKPTAGLDLDARGRFLQLLQRVRETRTPRRTLLMSSNLLSDAQYGCDHVAVMLRGQIVAEGDYEAIARKLAGYRVFELQVAGRGPEAVAWLRGHPGVRHADVHGDFLIFVANHHVDAPALVRDLHRSGHPVRQWREHEIDFESLVTPEESSAPRIG